MSRILGIDYGRKRVGLAVSDPTGTIARPLPTLKRRPDKRPPYRRIVEATGEHEIDAVVVGLPLAPSGEETEWTKEARDFGDELGRRLGVPVHYVDERMTSIRAERAIRSIGLPKEKREEKERIDAAAAQLILQAWLDRPGDAKEP